MPPDADSAPASPPVAADNLNNNLDNADSTSSLSPFLPGLALHLPEFLQHPAIAAAPTQPTPTAASPADDSDAAPATTAAPAVDPFWVIHDLKKRQTTTSTGGTACPTSYRACAALGAPGLCCSVDSNCAVDQAGHVACCPDGAVCTGTIRASSGRTISGATTVTGSSSTSLSFVFPTTTTGVQTTTGGFIVVASTTVAEPNAAAGRRGLIPVVGWFL
ncbi:hypothetical protein SLS56_009781 [Neofusicoccum ribis]|uniref:Hydrophobin n=1 Tax=Neofusicoccum ribis TaxID=45134 RepID=A0ABR3SG96_9PEZI